jgi:hypothetical protein
VPTGASIIKLRGGGQNYVHGGAAPQEMIVPLVSAKMQRYHVETAPASISLISMANKVTSLIISLDFIQTEPVSDVVKETTYKLYFVSDGNEKISSECIYVADSKETDAQKRVFRLNSHSRTRSTILASVIPL